MHPGPVNPATAPSVDALINTTGGLGLAEAFMAMSPALREIARVMARTGAASPAVVPQEASDQGGPALPARILCAS